MARYIDVLNDEEKAAQQRTKEVVAELGTLVADRERTAGEVAAMHSTKQTLARTIESLRGERRKLDGEIVGLSSARDGIRRSMPRDPEVEKALKSGAIPEDLYASMKPDKYGVAVYHVKNAIYDKWFLKMRWGNTARIIAEGSEDAVCAVASNIIKLTHPPDATVRAIMVPDKKALFDTKDC